MFVLELRLTFSVSYKSTPHFPMVIYFMRMHSLIVDSRLHNNTISSTLRTMPPKKHKIEDLMKNGYTSISLPVIRLLVLDCECFVFINHAVYILYYLERTAQF